jgi:hypothetical protein
LVLKREEFPFPNHDNTSHLTANIYTFSVEELFQAPWFNWILSSDVKELVFSFHYSDVIIGNYCCSGTENVFFVHYRYSLGTFGCTYIDKTITFHAFPVVMIIFGSTGDHTGLKTYGKQPVLFSS